MRNKPYGIPCVHQGCAAIKFVHSSGNHKNVAINVAEVLAARQSSGIKYVLLEHMRDNWLIVMTIEEAMKFIEDHQDGREYVVYPGDDQTDNRHEENGQRNTTDGEFDITTSDGRVAVAKFLKLDVNSKMSTLADRAVEKGYDCKVITRRRG